LVWTIAPVNSGVAVTSDEVSSETACEELPVVNGVIVIKPAAAALVIFCIIFMHLLLDNEIFAIILV
jgi:hypothetical protein